MKNFTTKIAVIILIVLQLSGCNTTKKVLQGKHLLVKNEIIVNGTKTKDDDVQNLIFQKPNTSILGYHFRLNLYNLAMDNADSVYKMKFYKNPEKYKRMAKWLSKKQVDRLGESFWYSGIHSFLKKTGEPPIIIDENKAKKTVLRLKSYYFNKGFFDVQAKYTIDTISTKKAKIKYTVTKGAPYIIDSLKTKIETAVLDSIYSKNKTASFLKKAQYDAVDLEMERNRITNLYRNNGVYHFQQNYISYDVDTVDTGKKPNLTLLISNRSIRVNDTTKTEPFKVYKIKKINIYTDAISAKNGIIKKDSISYKDLIFYSSGKLKFKPKAIGDAVFINKNNLFSDDKTLLTVRYLNNLRVFNYPSIQYEIDVKDTLSNALIANVYLTQRKKFNMLPSFGVTHSNIQEFGITGNLPFSIRNVFHGAETLELTLRSNFGSSKNLANPDNRFFNISELGGEAKLIFPKFLFLFPIERIVPHSMIPSTTISLGFSKQKNLGLDKENFTGSLGYNWTPRKNKSVRFDLFNVQYVKNVNTANYFNVYRSSYNTLNTIGQNYESVANSNYYDGNHNLIIENGTSGFIADALNNSNGLVLNTTDAKSIRSIEERRKRLTENDLIFATSLVFSRTTKTDIADNTFYSFRTKFESAGNLLSFFARQSKQSLNTSGNYTLFGVDYSQYLKTEFEYIKHWDLHHNTVFALRTFFGVAIPYGNSNSIPFSRSYFAGGSNDNRAWQAYSLGPGRSGAVNDFNEANLKIAFSSEMRFNIFKSLNGALFADAGNIWNIYDNVDDEASVFSGVRSLKDIALGSGFGFRYDFSFFVVRLDFGFKTYDPASLSSKKWFRDYNFNHSVLNIGINYPF